MTTRGSRAVHRVGAQRRSRRAGTSAGDRSAALLVRVWLEDGAQVFRGRLTAMETSPGGTGAEEVAVALAASPRDVVDAVRAWLDRVTGDARDPVDGDG